MFGLLVSGILFLSGMPGDTLSLAPAVVTSVKETLPLEKLAAPSSHFRVDASSGIGNQHSLSQMVPGLQIPEYGASLTSTIYIRGLGSRMENPSLGLYLDDIPVLDKNAYDIPWFGIHSGALLRGPQGSLYGRNTMGGVLLLRTRPAWAMDGWEGSVEAGLPGSLNIGISGKAGENHSISGNVRLRRGYYVNEYSGKLLDPYAGGVLRWRWDKALNASTDVTNTFHLGLSDEGGFAYGRYRDGVLYPVNYNDEGSYGRISLLEGFKLMRRGKKVRLSSVSSLQLLADRMRMDQDYTQESIFTLEQRQRSVALTQELILAPAEKYTHWRPQTGFFAFARLNRLVAPVVFKEDGIRTLILDNANRNIPPEYGYLDITEKTFPVNSDFLLGGWDAALYHESVWELGRWLLTAGIRLDYEGGYMHYDSEAFIHYRFAPVMVSDKGFSTSYKGYRVQHYFQVLPKLSALYECIRGEDGYLRAYGTVSKGYRAGGFNTQIFSDILQGQMMTGLMEDLGVYLDNPPALVTAGHTEYKPEEAWNYELGLRFKGGSFWSGEVNTYYIDCRNQQLTVFPPGKTTGRMMTNAGRSRSMGVEAELDYRRSRFHSHLSYSYCDARFVDYNDGNADYAGNRIPYVPAHSYYLEADGNFSILGLEWMASGDVRGSGPVWWNEDNSRSSGPTFVLGATLGVELSGGVDIYLRGENLTGRQYPSFYFKSIGNEFFALSRPLQIILGVKFKVL